MGGGGHPGAGSALLKTTDPHVIKEMLEQIIKGNQQTSVILRDIMSYPVVKVNENTPVDEVALILRKVGCTGLPVVNDHDRITGIISRRDFRKIKKPARCSRRLKLL